MMPKDKMTVFLVIDRGGEWEDRWSSLYMAFADEQAAKECAEKRTKRGLYRRGLHGGLGDARDDWPDYIGSFVCAVDMFVNYFGAKEVSSDG